jgi:hypothetical protein
MVYELWLLGASQAAEILFWTEPSILRNLNFWPKFECHLRKTSIPMSYITFLTFWWLLICLNLSNDSKVMIVESYRWLLEILVWNEWSNLSTSEFELNWSEICWNTEHQSHRAFHKLSTEGRNSKLWYQTKEPWSVEVGKILEIWLRIGINIFKYLLDCEFLLHDWFSRFASWCNMNARCHDNKRSYPSSPKEMAHQI